MSTDSGTRPIEGERPIVLHVVEALGGGVMVALRDYIVNTQDAYDHVILGAHRDGHDTGDLDEFSVLRLRAGKSPLGMIRQLRQVVDQMQPDLIHLHSSWAGLVGRLAFFKRSNILYTPHCYAFERLDYLKPARVVFWIVEALLAFRTRCVIAVSPREANLARSLPGSRSVYYVPNTAIFSEPDLARNENSRITIVAAGRVMRQKGPRWYSQYARHLANASADISLLWLGGGEPELESELSAAGVQVSGWISRAELVERLSTADLYVHSAAWEGAPLLLLEAASMGVPVIARDIPALRSLGVTHLFTDPVEAATFTAKAIEANSMVGLIDDSHRITKRHAPAKQREALLAAYKFCVDTTSKDT
ncbi:glycosyltransferase [Streptomyces sp. NP160]|uniref:glycosyltransferase n=1 Tax=Streptomyces sp. NP160 TaxID=2586637 RepID=UPI0015D64E49|nr:glycosyltransferase [Streptomyces sp. NP160]